MTLSQTECVLKQVPQGKYKPEYSVQGTKSTLKKAKIPKAKNSQAT